MRSRILLALFFVWGCAPDAHELTDEVAPGETAGQEDPQSAGQPVLVSSERDLQAGAQLRITMVDVGQGDGLVVQFPTGKVLAIDGGPNHAALPGFLRAQGISQVDYAVLTHAHDDHHTGLAPVMDLLPQDCAQRVMDPGYDSPLVGYHAFRTAAGCRYRSVGIGQSLGIDPKVAVSVLSAYDSLNPNNDSHGVNNTSVVLHLRYGRFSMLFEGDAETESEQAEWQHHHADLRSTVLKIGHHGSCTASGTSFLKAVAPRYILMSVGTGNTYGLPHCQTLAKLKGLKSSGVKWLRTDLNGTISVVTDGSRYTVTPSRGADSGEACPRDCATPADF